jgi:hypothetical protein
VINASLNEANNISFNLSKFEEELPGGIKNYTFFVSPEKETRLGYLWNYQKLEKTGVYASFVDARYNIGPDLIFCFVTTEPFVIRDAESYSGTGGIFCKPNHSDAGFVIEPLLNYLKDDFPVYWED